MKKWKDDILGTITALQLPAICCLFLTGLPSCSKKIYPDTVYTIFPETGGQVLYSDSLTSGVSGDSLYSRAKTWLLSYDSVWGTHRIKIADPATGTLQAQNRMDIYFELPLITQLGTIPEKGYFNYRLTIIVQDFSWKYRIEDIRSYYCQRDQSLERAGVARGRFFEFPVSNQVSRFNQEWMTERYLMQLYTGIDRRIRRLTESLTAAMNR